MFKVGMVTVTKHNSYNEVKHYIANQILLSDDKYLPSTRHLAQVIGASKSAVSKVLITLCEDDRWLDRISDGNSPRNTIYKIIATTSQAKAYKNYYLLPTRKKTKFRKMFKDGGQTYKSGQSFKWFFGDSEVGNTEATA